jgi:endonuclease YncB( thermonuclease family)
MTSGSWRSLVVAAFWALFTGASAASWVVEGRVVGISDGDTITILDREKVQHKIRLHGIDAPEKGQAFGDRSKENLSRLVFDKTIEAHCHKKDRYSREVCKVMRGSTDVNLEQLRAGMAWWYREYAKEQSPQERARYAATEDDARARRIGLLEGCEAGVDVGAANARQGAPGGRRFKSCRARRRTRACYKAGSFSMCPRAASRRVPPGRIMFSP